MERAWKLVRESLVTKLILAVVSGITLTSLVVALVSLRITGRYLREQLEQELPHTAQQLKTRIEAWQENRRLEMRAFANSALVVEALNQLQELPARSPWRPRVQEELTKYLNYIQEPLDHYEGFLLLGRGGVLLARSDSVKVEEELLRQLGSWEQGPTEKTLLWFGSAPEGPRQILLSAVDDRRHQLLGLLVGVVRLAKLGDFFLELDAESGRSTHFTICNPAGQVILSFPENSPGVQARGNPPRLKSGSWLAETGDRLVEYRDADGQRVVAAVTELPSLGWLLAERDYASAFAPLFSIRRRTLLLAGGILLGFSLLAWRSLHSLLGPIEQLARGVEQISLDQLEVNLPEGSADEIGRLTRAFNRMAERLRSNRQEIEWSQRNLSESNARLEQANLTLAQKNAELERANLKLSQLAVTDPLTGLYNLRHLSSILEREMIQSQRQGQPLSVLMIDIDNFKQVNDEYGHSAGDSLLKEIAGVFQESLRRSDYLGRIGGEEFLAVLPDTDRRGVREVAEKIRLMAEEKRFRIPGAPEPVSLTISIGTATIGAYERVPLRQVQFINRADKAMYQAKRQGKNRVVDYEDL